MKNLTRFSENHFQIRSLKTFRCYFIFTASVLGMITPALAFAAGAGPTTIYATSIQFGKFFVQVPANAQLSNAWPACATNHTWVVDPSTDAGKITISAILSTQLAGRSISIQGTGDCNTYAGSETVYLFVVN